MPFKTHLEPPPATNAPTLATPFTLPCGEVVKNRLLKSAMSEQLGNSAHDPTRRLATLYRTWAHGGVGLQVTGNVMVDRTALGEPFNVVLDEASDGLRFTEWARAGREGGAQLWMQLNHPGKQSPAFLSKEPVAPSAVPLGGALAKAFRPPRALEAREITGLIERFARAAELARDFGFSGVQIHGAHGYLVSQFLSPHHNRRTDEWGGSPENRRRFVVEIYRAIRERVGASFPVGLKLNSADFQKGGFSQEESIAVAQALASEGIDLVEISGGSYEAPVMTGYKVAESTRQREAYFLEFANLVRATCTVPLVVTGGFRSGAAMAEALKSGATDFIGLARPLAIAPDFPNKLLRDRAASIQLPRPSTGFRAIDRSSMIDITFYEAQLARLSRGLDARPNGSAWWSVLSTIARLGLSALRPRRA
jgi:2,4-dienoyl-CoA reductase-like NADH-dependent reductase (Old Yellow Enzyme family)